MDASPKDPARKRRGPRGLAFVSATKCFTFRELRLCRFKSAALVAQARRSGLAKRPNGILQRLNAGEPQG